MLDSEHDRYTKAHGEPAILQWETVSHWRIVEVDADKNEVRALFDANEQDKDYVRFPLSSSGKLFPTGGSAEGFLAEGYRVIGFDIERHDYGTGGYPPVGNCFPLEDQD